MALIKCPECSKDVSTAADTCPHCGYPIRRSQENVIKEEKNEVFPEPKDISWIEKWKKKAKKEKLIWLIPLIVSLIPLIIFIILACTDVKTTEYGYTYHNYSRIYFIYIFAGLFLIILTLFILKLIMYRVQTRQYDGYTILFYNSFKHYLVIEDTIQDSSYVNRYLYGSLPNKKNVWVSISAWDTSVNMGVGEPGNEKNIIL